jgi:parallel beta-helix repeat protein
MAPLTLGHGGSTVGRPGIGVDAMITQCLKSGALRGSGALKALVAGAATSTPAAAAAALVVFTLPAPLASALVPRLHCGDEVVQSTTLSRDLMSCAGNGLVIGADDITLDLNGHTVDGRSGAPTGDHFGILLDGHTGVTVTGGSVTGFQVGVLVVEGRDDRLTRLDIQGSTDKAIVLAGSRRNAVTNNRLHDNADAAIGLFQNSDRNRVSRNDLLRNGPQGIENLFSDHNVVTRNRISRTGSGVILESSDGLRITHNTVMHGVASACDGCGIAIQVYGDRNVVAHNRIVDSPRYGIEVDDFQDPGHSPAFGNILRKNRVTRAGVGIALGPEAGGVVLRTRVVSNRVGQSDADGVQLTGPSTGLASTLLADNVAVSNGAYGIEAVPGVRDGGGNRAMGNRNTPQCLNVLCSPGVSERP